eukprot:Amastigsp_a183727_6.p2 type:complete len:180 gc:universal Amastigsp_a183727_6:723-184(-)
MALRSLSLTARLASASLRLTSPVAAAQKAAVHSSTAARGKLGFHPRRFPVRVVCTDGSTYTMWSTLPMGTIKLMDDRFSHPEFTEGVEKTDTKRGGQVGKFLNRFRGFDTIDKTMAATVDPAKLENAQKAERDRAAAAAAARRRSVPSRNWRETPHRPRLHCVRQGQCRGAREHGQLFS